MAGEVAKPVEWRMAMYHMPEAINFYNYFHWAILFTIEVKLINCHVHFTAILLADPHQVLEVLQEKYTSPNRHQCHR